MELGALTGTWINSNPDTNSVAVVKARDVNGKLQLQITAVGPDGFVDWGKADAHVFAATTQSHAGAGFTCRYDFGFAETRLQGMIMKGLLVLAQFHLFKDDSKRASYFLREYFAATTAFSRVNMTEKFQFKQSSHLDPTLTDPAATANTASLLGRWLNTNRDTRGIAECVVAQDGEGVTVSITEVGNNEPVRWPSARATVLANLEEEAGQRTIALLAKFDLGYMTADTHVRVNKGVLVIVLYVTFHDDSGRSNYLNREFFYRSE